MKYNVEKKLFSVIFVVMLVIPLLSTNLKPNMVSKSENRALASFPQLYDSEGNINKNYVNQFENWFNDNVGLRDFFFGTNSKIQYDLFNNSAVSDVVVGRDGWLFYNKSNNMQIASNEYPGLDEGDLQIICNRQVEIKNRLADMGIEYILFLPPSKVSIYPEYLNGNFSITKTPVDIVADYLQAHSDIKVIRLKEALLEEKDMNPEALLYYKTDTHWNAYGAYVAYKEMVKTMQNWGIVATDPAEVNFNEDSWLHDLMGTMVNDNEKYYEESLTSTYSILEPKAHQIADGEKYSFIQNYIQSKFIRRADYFVNENLEAPVFLVFGDSMFMDFLVPIMAENSSAIVGIWSYDISEEIINCVKPDVVFSELTERELASLENTSEEFVQSKIFVDDSKLVVKFCDFGEYENMWFPIWSEENDKDDIVWYTAQRDDEWHWKVEVDLNAHKTNGLYHIHFYQGITDDYNNSSYVHGVDYNVGTLFFE